MSPEPETLAELSELRRKLSRLETALNAIVDAIVWVDEHGSIQWANASFRRLIGQPQSDPLGKPLVEMLPLAYAGQSIPNDRHPIHLALEGRPNTADHYELVRPDRELILELFAVRVQFSKHELSTVVAIRDITERYRAAQQLRELAEREQKRATELDQAYRELKETQTMLVQAEKMSAVGQLASGIAHEVKNPLAMIMQGVGYLEGELKPEQTSQREVLQMLRESVQRADKIVRDLLKFSRRSPLELAACDINQVLEHSLELIRQHPHVAKATVVKELEAALPMVMADQTRLEQVFINLMINALLAMPHGGTLTVRTVTGMLATLGRRDGAVRQNTGEIHSMDPVLVCEITDTGIGIPRHLMAKVFDPFFTTRAPGEGTGLGLSITRAIIEQHHGLIEVESTEGVGTTMRIILPVRPTAAALPPTHEVPHGRG